VGAINEFKQVMAKHAHKLDGDLDRNILLTTMLGTFKPTCLSPTVNYAGRAANFAKKKVLVVGIQGYPDFDAKYYGKALKHSLELLSIDSFNEFKAINVPFPSLEGQANLLSMTLARKMDKEDVMNALVSEIRSRLNGYEPDIIGFPPMLGAEKCNIVVKTLSEALERILVKLGGQILRNLTVIEPQIKDGVIQKVKVRQGEYKTFEIKAEKYVLATGNFIGGGLIENKGLLREPIFNLPLFDINGKNILHARFQTLINRAVLPPEGHDFIACGVKINDSLQPVDDNENIIYSNLHAAGAVISGYNYIAEKSGMGVAISSGHEVGVQLAGRK